MQKKAIVLFITVALIGILTPLVWQNISQANKAIQSVQKEKFFITRSIILRDIHNALNVKNKKVENSEDLDNFFVTLPPIVFPKEDVFIDISLERVFDKVNINNLLSKGKEDKYMTQFIVNISQKYKLSNTDMFLSLLLDTIDEDEEERFAFSEISLNNKDFRNAAIFNQEHLQYILDVYYEHTMDKSIYSIPWEKLVYFGEKESENIIDCQRASSEVLELLGFQGDFDDGCKLVKKEESKTLAKALHVESFSKHKSYQARVNIQIKRQNENQKFELIYDLKYNTLSGMKRVWL